MSQNRGGEFKVGLSQRETTDTLMGKTKVEIHRNYLLMTPTGAKRSQIQHKSGRVKMTIHQSKNKS